MHATPAPPQLSGSRAKSVHPPPGKESPGHVPVSGSAESTDVSADESGGEESPGVSGEVSDGGLVSIEVSDGGLVSIEVSPLESMPPPSRGGTMPAQSGSPVPSTRDEAQPDSVQVSPAPHDTPTQDASRFMRNKTVRSG